jgi:hypothetical protein
VATAFAHSDLLPRAPLVEVAHDLACLRLRFARICFMHLTQQAQ